MRANALGILWLSPRGLKCSGMIQAGTWGIHPLFAKLDKVETYPPEAPSTEINFKELSFCSRNNAKLLGGLDLVNIGPPAQPIVLTGANIYLKFRALINLAGYIE